MMQIGLADVQYPEIERIPGAAAYLVVLWPEYEALTFWTIIGNLIRTSFIIGVAYLLVRIGISNWEYLYGWFNLTYDSIKGLL
jgi:hypothetical protein